MKDYLDGNKIDHMLMAAVTKFTSGIDDIATIKGLLDLGANPNFRSTDKDGWTILMCAAYLNKYEICNLLMDRGALVDAKGTADDSTSLIWACTSENLELIKLFVNRGANVNSMDKKGFTPLCITAENGDVESVKFLLSKGANLEIGDGYKNPLEYALESGKHEVVSLLEARALVADMKGEPGKTQTRKKI